MLSCVKFVLLSSIFCLLQCGSSGQSFSQFTVGQSASSKSLDSVLSGYLSNSQLEQHLREFTNRTGCSDISRLSSIGKSLNGTELWVLEISNNPGKAEAKPNFKYAANMHGDEPSGRVLLVALAEWLCSNWKSNELARRMVEEVKLYLLPTVNPDGFASRTRGNRAGVDLNRDFPDPILDGGNLGAKGTEQPETLAVMNWILSKHFVASASMHEGAFVANYPWDGIANGLRGSNRTDNDATFQYLARSYASLNPNMTSPSNEFPSGITNGAAWYPVTGGMQDWNYIVGRCMELTLELSMNKYPPASTLRSIWNSNLASMLSFPMTALFGGLRGYTLGSTSSSDETYPVEANLTIIGSSWNVTSDPDFGNFYRPLAPGQHVVLVNAQDHEPQTKTITIPANNAGLQLNFTLLKVTGRGRGLGSTGPGHLSGAKHASLPRKFGGIQVDATHGIVGDEELLITQNLWIQMLQNSMYLVFGFVLAVLGTACLLLLRRRLQAAQYNQRR